jgi:hypothetical protein
MRNVNCNIVRILKYTIAFAYLAAKTLTSIYINNQYKEKRKLPVRIYIIINNLYVNLHSVDHFLLLGLLLYFVSWRLLPTTTDF